MVTSYNIAGTSSDVPTDQISLNFTKIEFEYIPQNADGTAGSPIRAGYDIGKNKRI